MNDIIKCLIASLVVPIPCLLCSILAFSFDYVESDFGLSTHTFGYIFLIAYIIGIIMSIHIYGIASGEDSDV